MELFIFVRLHAVEGKETEITSALRDVISASREEPGCRAIDVYRSTRDARLFYIHSVWVDEAAFETHASLPHTVRFLERVGPLIDHTLEVTRARPVAW